MLEGFGRLEQLQTAVLNLEALDLIVWLTDFQHKSRAVSLVRELDYPRA